MSSLKCNLGNELHTSTLDGVTRTETVHKWHVHLEVCEDFIRRRLMIGKSMDEIIVEARIHKAKPRKPGQKRKANKAEISQAFSSFCYSRN